MPKTNKNLLKITIIILSIIFMALSAHQFYIGLNNGSLFNIIVGFLLLSLSVFLWRLKTFARQIVKFIITMSLIIGIGGTFNPFFAMDYEAAHNGEAPDWLSMITIAIPLIAISFLVFWILDKYRAEFK